MSCFRMMDQNYITLETLANTDFSSEQTAFPITNAYNKKRRSKVWRTNGYFNVVEGENTIIFRETTLTDLTATVVADEYTSATTFMAAVKAALEDVGASTYTITQNSNLKFSITSNGFGGGGILEFIWTDSDSESMAGMLGFSVDDNDTGALTYLADFLRINSNEWVLWDFGISSNPSSFILIGPRNEPIKISPDAIVTLQGSETNNWDNPSYETVLTYDDEAIAILSEDGLHTQALRFWRLNIYDQNPLGYIEIGAFFLGKHFGGDRGRVQFPLNANYEDRSNNITSEGGQTFSDIKQKSENYSVTWSFLTKEDVERIDQIFDVYGLSFPFFISMDSGAVFSSTFNRRIKFVKFVNEPKYQLVSANNFTMDMQFREEL